MYWVLGPILYIATLVIVLPKAIEVYSSIHSYHFPPQLALIGLFFNYAIPEPFIYLATLDKTISYHKQWNRMTNH